LFSDRLNNKKQKFREDWTWQNTHTGITFRVLERSEKMKKSSLVRIIILLVASITLSGCVWPYWWDDGGHHGGGRWHDEGRHEGYRGGGNYGDHR
jgi:hypothetical protein